MFSVGACLWFCADYGLTESEEPVLSKTLQNLLVDMTQSTVEERPTLQQLVQVSTALEDFFSEIPAPTRTQNQVFQTKKSLKSCKLALYIMVGEQKFCHDLTKQLRIVAKTDRKISTRSTSVIWGKMKKL